VLRPAIALLAVAAIIPQFVVLAAGAHLSNSQAAFEAKDATRARSEALAAKAIEPWAASPYLQLGLVSEAESDFAAAAQYLDAAISRSRRDYRLWLTAARIEARAGNGRRAIRDLQEARRLNPNLHAVAGG
jgi:tetratricopeptide (TPR) repeat protein